MAKLKASLGGAPKEAACEAFGRAPGIAGMIAERVGMPPDWTDKGAAASGTQNESAPPVEGKAVAAVER